MSLLLSYEACLYLTLQIISITFLQNENKVYALQICIWQVSHVELNIFYIPHI